MSQWVELLQEELYIKREREKGEKKLDRERDGEEEKEKGSCQMNSEERELH